MISRVVAGIAFAEGHLMADQGIFHDVNNPCRWSPACLAWNGSRNVASVCWIVSVFLYGIEKAADVLQLAAASSWLVAMWRRLESLDLP